MTRFIVCNRHMREKKHSAGFYGTNFVELGRATDHDALIREARDIIDKLLSIMPTKSGETEIVTEACLFMQKTKESR